MFKNLRLGVFVATYQEKNRPESRNGFQFYKTKDFYYSPVKLSGYVYMSEPGYIPSSFTMPLAFIKALPNSSTFFTSIPFTLVIMKPSSILVLLIGPPLLIDLTTTPPSTLY